MLNWVNVASLWKSVGQGQRLPHARHTAPAGSAVGCFKDTAETINKAESPSVQMSL